MAGRKVSDGKAFNLTVPAEEEVVDGELYRIDGLNGFAIGEVGAEDTARTLAFEADTNAVWAINLPNGLDPSPGDILYWDDPTDFQYGAEDLVDTPGGPPACLVVAAATSDTLVRVRVINGVPLDAIS